MNVLGHVLGSVAVVTNGLAAGIMLSTVIGIVPMFLAQPYDAYVRSVHFLWRRYDPIMPISNGATLALDVALAAGLARDGSVRAGYITAAALLACVMTISITRNVPINRYVFALDPLAPPADWAQRDPRRRWRAWNLTRTALAVLAFAANVTALLQLT